MILSEARIRALNRRAAAAAVGAAAAAAVLGLLAGAALDPLPRAALALVLALAGFAAVYAPGARRRARRARLASSPFPEAWEALLQQHVAFYRGLDEAGRERFRRAVALFLAEKKVTGVDVPADDLALVLVAASAVIPVFGLPEWTYRSVVEVLVYPESFDDDYEVRARRGDMLGMAPSQTSTIILSRAALIEGFGPHHGLMHVGIHEFLHAIDGEDGEVDGYPSLLLDAETGREWARIAREHLKLLDRGGTILDLYAGEDEGELFAVAGEHFFLEPASLARSHPELYGILARMLRQDPAGRAAAPHRRPRPAVRARRRRWRPRR